MNDTSKKIDILKNEIELLQNKQLSIQEDALKVMLEPVNEIINFLHDNRELVANLVNNALEPVNNVLQPINEALSEMESYILGVTHLVDMYEVFDTEITKKFDEINKRAEILAPDFCECAILYYITIGYKIKECKSVQEIFNLIDSEKSKGNQIYFSLDFLTKRHGKICHFDKVQSIFIDYYTNENGCEYTIDNLIELLTKINECCNIQEEIDIVIKCKELDSVFIINTLINIIEELCTKLVNNKWNHMNWKESDAINANDAIKGIISLLCLNVTYDNFTGKIDIPNRHAIVHYSVTCCSDYDNMCNILIDMVYKILNCKYLQCIKRNSK